MGSLVLWDVDHTLVENSGVSKAIYGRAFSPPWDQVRHALESVVTGNPESIPPTSYPAKGPRPCFPA
ncbi:MAG: hypothetical protein ACRDQ7_04710 [Haloechinothrix sp.]